jgi:hypothetical protein
MYLGKVIPDICQNMSEPLPPLRSLSGLRRPLLMISALGVMGLSACRMVPSHFHSKANDEAMKKAKAAMDAQNTAAPGIYKAMLSNLDLFAKEENRVLTALAEVAGQSSVAYKDVEITKKVLTELIDDGKSSTKGEINVFINDTLPAQIRKMDGLTQQQKDVVASAKYPLNALGDEIGKKKGEIIMYNSSIALLRTAIIDAPGLSTSFAGSVNLDTAWAAVSTVQSKLSKKITYVDADGKTQDEEAYAVGERAYKWFQVGAKAPRAQLLPQAPGIDLIVLNASLKLLEVQRDAASAELDYLDKARVVLAEAYTRALLARELARDSLMLLEREPSKMPNTFPTQMEMQTRIARKILDKNKETQEGDLDKPIDPQLGVIRISLLSVRKLAVAKSTFARSQALLEVGLQRVDHQRSIALSNVNDAGRRAVVSRAIEGLQVYHSSGFRPEHLAQIAQVVALGAIALK